MKRPSSEHSTGRSDVSTPVVESSAAQESGISRRDFIHGVALAGMGVMVPSATLAEAVEAASSATPYPPALMGLRGNHDGAWETAHQLARAGQRSFGPVSASTESLYDLIVVGAGISGLAAAYFYCQKHPDARVLLLDNHDDFGGHAKRNEFTVGGRTVLGYGGSQTLESPGGYPQVVKSLLKDIGVEADDFYPAYDDGFYQRHDLAGGIFFNEKDWGTSSLIRLDVGGLGDYMPLADAGLSAEKAVSAMPLSPTARLQLLRVLTETRDCMPDVPMDEKRDYLYTITYRRFLERHLGVTEPEVFRVLQDLASDTGMGIENALAGSAIFYSVLPGRGATGLPADTTEYEPYIHHFPDGNASIARLLVSHLIPAVSTAKDMHDVVGASFDYTRLDDASADVRLRLSSTVVNVRHRGSPESAEAVDVTYVRDGESKTVEAKKVILACYHAMIPSICPELPETQREAMASQVKMPILYTNVALNNWRAWKELGVGAFVAPGAYHVNAMLDFPVSLGNYQYAQNPDQPVIVHMERFPHGREPGLSKRDRLRAGRYELLSTPYADIEHSIRAQLGEALGPGGFDGDRDIAGITVNRWAHGYSYYYDELEEDIYDEWDDPRYPHVKARQPFGRIAMANSDADANAMLEAAVEQGYRAVLELV